MRGRVKNASTKGYGFIREHTSGTEYFFHMSDYQDDYNELKDLVEGGSRVEVEFDLGKSDKGPRAAQVRKV